MRESVNSVAGEGASVGARQPEQPADHMMSRGRTRSAMPHLPTVLVLLVTLGVTAALALIARDVVKDQEKALLEERVSEVGLLLQSSINPVTASLSAAGAVAADQGESDLFDNIAGPLTLNGGQLSVVEQRGDDFVRIAYAGAASPGKEVAEPIAAVLEEAIDSTGMLTEMVKVSGADFIVFATGVTGYENHVVYLGAPYSAEQAAEPEADSPYRELNLAVYLDSEPNEDSLLLASGTRPEDLDGDDVVTQELEIGSDTWLIVASPREPLVGGFASKAAWLAAGAGLLLALSLAVVVELIVRRRAYALRLVDERTASLREAQLAAEKANRAKSDFLSRMSHELRTPLNSVLGFAQLLALDDLTEEQSDSLLQISRGGRHLLDLINEILDISRIETGTLSISLEPVLVEDVVAEVGSLVRPLADERGITLRVDTSLANDAYITADRRRVKQVLLNLMGNAIKYNREGGRVELSCTAATDGMLRIVVADNGQGIPEEKYELLFEPFERLGAETTGVEGTGVGLALSKGLAEAMGGTIDFTSEVGKGSSFWLEVPISTGPMEMPEEQLPDLSEVDLEGARHTVLCVEDNPTNLKLIERVLQRRPRIRLVSTPNGHPAVELAQQHHAELILLDMNLGDMSGSDVLRALRDDPTTAHIPVVVVSADATPTRVARLMQEGASAYLTKPIDVEELLGVVDDTLADTSPEVV